MLIKSVFNKNKNHHYYNAFVEECLYQWPKCNDSKIFWQYDLWRFDNTKPIKIWDVDVDRAVVSKLIKMKNNWLDI